jgi:hypothetical protein
MPLGGTDGSIAAVIATLSFLAAGVRGGGRLQGCFHAHVCRILIEMADRCSDLPDGTQPHLNDINRSDIGDDLKRHYL